jgi:enoyl-CoA hydratase
MDYQDILMEQTDAVMKITVNRPEARNAQSRIMLEEFDDALMSVVEDDSVRVVIVAGAGDHFSAGHDLGSQQEKDDRIERPLAPGIAGAYRRSYNQNFSNSLRWRDFPKPTIAQVQGYCIMGGLILATACDLIIASEDAQFCDRTVRWGGPHVQYASLPWEVGFRKAKEYLFTGDWIDAREAERVGPGQSRRCQGRSGRGDHGSGAAHCLARPFRASIVQGLRQSDAGRHGLS